MRQSSRQRSAAIVLLALCAAGARLSAQPPAVTPPPRPDAAVFDGLGRRIDPYVAKPRAIVLSDIANEPDDQMSLVRLLVYSNQLDIEALVATTSRHLRQGPRPDVMRAVIGAYGKVQARLLEHEPGFPAAAALDALVVAGQGGYGMTAVGDGQSTPGSDAIVKAADADDPRPLWISVWGGANTLAQALWHVRATRTPAELERVISKLRVYTISDQDDAGPWLRREFPALHYIATPGDTADYHVATWTGLAGDDFYRNAPGADGRTIAESWVTEHIRKKGPLGAYYPYPCCMIEGDTPSYLSLLDNGLVSYMNPSFGGWGGRYIWRQPWLESRPYWTNGRLSRDTVTGVDGRAYTSDQATIWRWRTAYMHDFAARMAWTERAVKDANHNPEAVVNGMAGKAPIELAAQIGTPVRLDASQSRDRDGHTLRFAWIFYPEAWTGVPGSSGPPSPGATASARPESHAGGLVSAIAPGRRPAPPPRLVLSGTEGAVTTVTPNAPGIAHVILAVTDDGTPSLTSYRRVIFTVN